MQPEAAIGRSERKRQAILTAAGAVFLDKGYDGASMDEVAAAAKVSKQTVYKHFTDKDSLFRAAVLATAGPIETMIDLVTDALDDASQLEENLARLARSLLVALTAPDVLATRRMVVASANRFPDVGNAWYEYGFKRALDALAATFADLAGRGLLCTGDAELAAEHFVGMLLWVPVNKAMFTGDHLPPTSTDIDRRAAAAARAFLHGYRQPSNG